jgi:cobalt-zinc-cadmium efflux system outer membrane protein
MRRVRARWAPAHLVFLYGMATAAGAPAAEPAGDSRADLTLPGALRRAIEAHPGLIAASFGVEAAEGRLRGAGQKPNPEAAVDFENFSGDLAGAKESETSLRISQRLETGGKRGARLAVARADRSLAGRDLEAARLDLVRDVRRDFVGGLAAQRELELAGETLAIAREVAEVAGRKVEAGALPAVEATRARVAIATAELGSQRAREAARLALERLALHWGGDPVPERIEGSLDSLPVVPATDTLVSRLPENPDLARWGDQRALERARLRFERSHGTPDLELGAGYRRLAAESRGTLLLGISTELPLRNRNQGAIRAAAADLERTSYDEERARRALEAELRDQAARLHVAQAEVRGLRRSVLPGAQEVYEGVRQGYERGRLTYLDVLEARRFLAEARQAEIAALRELEQSVVEIDRLLGRGETLLDEIREEGR